MARFQRFDDAAEPKKIPARVAELRRHLKSAGLDGLLVARTDAFLGEFIAEREERLVWLAGFTGSAGLALVLADRAVLFVDGRYVEQARRQTDSATFEVVDTARTPPAAWMVEVLGNGAAIGYDPWLHSMAQLKQWRDSGLRLVATSPNPLDLLWKDRPGPKRRRASEFPPQRAGQTAAQKRRRVVRKLREQELDALFVTSAEAASWLFNFRGSDVPHAPVAQIRALVRAGGGAILFAEKRRLPSRFEPDRDVELRSPDAWGQALREMAGKAVGVDPASTPARIAEEAKNAGVDLRAVADPVAEMKAVKNQAEIKGMREAHRTDGAAMVEFLAWLDSVDPRSVTEIDIVEQLESCRRAAGELRDIAFDTIAASGPNAALPHYRVTRASNRHLASGEFLLVDSGGQYPCGTTDVTRTIALGSVGPEMRRAYTLVLKAMIGVERLRFPPGTSGVAIDSIAREPLWREGLDYPHGTGHGVGCYLSVHEGPYALSQNAAGARLRLPPGLVLSNEPGLYEPGRYGIRIENLEIVRPPRNLQGRPMLGFEPLTLVPIDTTPVESSLLDSPTLQWINAYHKRVLLRIRPLVKSATSTWLERACEPLPV